MANTDEIKQKIDVVDLISSYLTLKKAGRNYRAPCPFHKEKDPSFMVSPEKQIWYCFGCNQGGDIFTFVEKMEGVDFVGALNMLADKAGVILDRSPGDLIKKGEKDKYFEIAELANKFFSYVLNKTKIGEEAKEYLIKKRKLTEKTIQDFSLGYAPNSKTSLKDFLFKKGYKEADLLNLGLISKNYRGEVVDKFRGRIIFPINNVTGRTVGFAGRIFKENKDPKFTPPKYLNSPQSDIYDKSNILYGLFQAKEAIREKELAVITEGYLDVISSHQAGVKNVVASSGTALTFQQIKIISRYTPNVSFAFDQDEAGRLASKRAMEMTRLENIDVSIVVISSGKDPDELIKENPQEWEKAVSNPIPIIKFFYNDVLEKYGKEKSIEDKKNISKIILPIIANIANKVEKAHWVKKISEDLGINEKYIMDQVDKTEVSSVVNRTESNDKEEKINISKEMLLLGAILLYPEKAKDFFSKVKEGDLLEEKAKNLYKSLFKWYGKEESLEKIDLEEAKKELKGEEKKELDVAIFIVEEFFDNLEKKEVFSDIERLVDGVVLRKKNREKRQIEKEIQLADKQKDREKIKELLKRLQDLI